ncbi:MAG: FAD-dependent oxidoreductase [Desulfobacterales bacterium]
MTNGNDYSGGGGPQIGPQDKEAYIRYLKNTFEQLPNDISLVLFSKSGQEDVFSDANRRVIRSFRELTDKIKFREYDLDHKEAEKYQVSFPSTLLIAPERYNIRWIGAPVGEEGRTFLETLLLVGLGKSNLNEQAAKIIQKIDTPRDIKVFVSPSCPYCPQQAVNAVKAAIENPEMVSLEMIDIQCSPELADQYAAHSVPQTFANDMLIAMGAQPEELFASSLDKLEQQTIFIPDSDAEMVSLDVLIIGGGPAGLTAGIYAARSGLNTAIVERAALGGQVATTPMVENYPGFTSVGGKTLVDIMVSHALEYVQIFQGEEVVELEAGFPIKVTTTRRRFETKTLLLATGATYKHLGVAGEDRLSGRGVSYCSTCDGPLFKGKKVIMVGGGNSAVTEALHLHNIGVEVTLVHRRDTLRAQEFLSRQLEENGIPILWNTEVQEILGKERVEAVKLLNNKTSEVTLMETNGVFIAIGYIPAVELADKIGVKLSDEGYVRHDGRHRTNIPGIYSAGDVEGGFKQIVTAAGQGSEAAIVIFEDLINPYWKKQQAV